MYALDHDRRSLQTLCAEMDCSSPGPRPHLVTADFTAPRGVPQLDGIEIANALPYVRDQRGSLRTLHPILAPTCRLIVEYDTDSGNRWVSYPLSARVFPQFVTDAGFRSPRIAVRVPSRFLGSIYAACALAPLSTNVL
jgi:hypothetical protein